MENITKEVIETRTIFNCDKIKEGDIVYAKRLLGCKINPDGSHFDSTYDIEDTAKVEEVHEDEMRLLFSFGSFGVDIADVVSGEWEIEFVG